jgi:N-acetylneuraminate synthase
MSDVYIMAEVGSTHDGSLGNALRMIDVFAELGADAIKFQCHFGQRVAADAPRPRFFQTEDRAEYFERTGFSPPEWREIWKACKGNDVDFVTSVFSVDAVKMLEWARHAPPDAYKLPSGQLTNTELRDALAATERPVYYSTGMARHAELKLPINEDWIEMHCTSEYPCSAEHALYNDMYKRFFTVGPRLGLSDHTMGLALSIAAVALGACAIERHVCFSRDQYGSDAQHSLEPAEFEQLVSEIRWLEQAMASTVTRDELMNSEQMLATRKVFLHGG